MVKTLYLEETDSTNDFLRHYMPGEDEDMTVVWTDFQRKGRGQGSNQWESEAGKNLTFSVLIHPDKVRAQDQYIISMAVAETMHRFLSGMVDAAIQIKWPNDIYVGDSKIGGILIENHLSGEHIKDCIIGIGLNINQRVFRSDAPNPVSMWQICEQETDCEQLLQEILQAFQEYMGKSNKDEYQSMLYRRKGFHTYADKDGAFMAEIIDVEDDGHLLLRDDNGQLRRYAFKEVTFVI